MKIKRDMIRRVAEGAKTFDMENLFPPRPLLEEMADAATGGAELQPRRTLRRRHYKNMPLIVQPEYKGDFLDRDDEEGPDLMEGEGVNIREAGNSMNLMDFTMPSEMLKHQEAPVPRELPPIWTENNRPGDGVGMQTLRDWYDRGWDDTDAPEMSEDKHLRMWKQDDTGDNKIRKKLLPTLPERLKRKVVRAYLDTLARHEDLEIDIPKTKIAYTLDDLMDAKRWHPSKDQYIDFGGTGVSVYPSKKTRPKQGLYVFRTSSGDGMYTTSFQVIPHGTERDVSKLHVRVSCTCKAWLYYGSQYNAASEHYLYGPIVPMFKNPAVRDPDNRTLVCKHVKACIEILKRYKLPPIPGPLREKLEKEPGIRVKKLKREDLEKLEMPKELEPLAKNPRVRFIEEQWDKASPKRRKNYIMHLDDPQMVSYFAAKYPNEATKYAVERLKQLWKEARTPAEKKAVEQAASIIPDTEPFEEPEEVKVPAELRRWEKSPLSRLTKTLPGMGDAEKRQVIKSQKNPDFLAYIAIKLHEDPTVVEAVIDRLEDLKTTRRGPSSQKTREIVREQIKRAKEEEMSPEDTAERAEHWLKFII